MRLVVPYALVGENQTIKVGGICYRRAGETTEAVNFIGPVESFPASCIATECNPCSVIIVPQEVTYQNNGGTGRITVTAGATCSWRVIGIIPNWITFTGSISGIGNGTINYSIASNNSSALRIASFTIGNQIHTITQLGQACAVTLNPSNVTIRPAGGTGNVTITTESNCVWQITSNANWITISNISPANRTGNGQFTYTVQPNTGTSSRTGTVTVNNERFTITQNSCNYTVSPLIMNFNSTGGTGSITVGTDLTCQWTATSSVGWITITRIIQQQLLGGNGTVEIRVDAANSVNPRTGTLLVAGQTVTITQSGVVPSITLTYSCGCCNIPQGCQFPVTVKTNAPDVQWFVRNSNNPECASASGSGIGDGQFTVYVPSLPIIGRTIGSCTATIPVDVIGGQTQFINIVHRRF